MPGGIHHEGIDQGELAYLFCLRALNLHEDHTVDHHHLYFLALAIAPLVHFHAGGDV